MKQLLKHQVNLLITVIALITVPTFFAACSQEDEPAAELQISVSAQGFSLEGEAETRATDVNYKTSFANGDQIGITVVASNNAILHNNVSCTFNGTVWTPAATITKHAGATYFAYYPYNSGNTNKQPAAIVNDFTPKIDQRLYADYTASDLMTWSVVSPSGPTLEIALTHRMALLEVSLPSDASEISIKTGGSTEISGNMYVHGGIRRYILKPLTLNLSGSYTNEGETFEWQQASVILAAGKCTRAIVSDDPVDGVAVTVNYEGQPSETVYVMSDGRIPFTLRDNTLISSVTVKEKTHLVGRKADNGKLKMKFDDDGNLQFRKADIDGYIPIGSYAEFQLIYGLDYNNNRDNKYLQEADLDLMNLDWRPIALYDGNMYGIINFYGEFDGGGKKISNLKIDKSDNANIALGTGLFSLNEGTIRNVHIASGEIKGKQTVGGICGSNHNTVTACSNNATVTGTNNNVGGVTGSNQGATTACRNTGNVTSLQQHYVGGVAGGNSSYGTITACYNTGNVTASGNSSEGVGGVVGNNSSGSIIACYNTGNVSSKYRFGGVAGSSVYSTRNIVTACYWQTDKGATAGIGYDGNSTTTTVTSFTTYFTPSGSAAWGTGSGSANGYWKAGTTSGGQLPKLYWEE